MKYFKEYTAVSAVSLKSLKSQSVNIYILKVVSHCLWIWPTAIWEIPGYLCVEMISHQCQDQKFIWAWSMLSLKPRSYLT